VKCFVFLSTLHHDQASTLTLYLNYSPWLDTMITKSKFHKLPTKKIQELLDNDYGMNDLHTKDYHNHIEELQSILWQRQTKESKAMMKQHEEQTNYDRLTELQKENEELKRELLIVQLELENDLLKRKINDLRSTRFPEIISEDIL